MYPFTARCAVRYRRWAALSIGPDLHNNSVVKAAYWKGVSAALDSIFLCETDHARRVSKDGNKDDYEDALMIARVMRKAVRACRRDMRDSGDGRNWSKTSETKADVELSHQMNMEAFPEDLPSNGYYSGKVFGEIEEDVARNQSRNWTPNGDDGGGQENEED